MLDYQRIVDDLRGSLYSQDEQGLDILRLAAAEYSLACDEANDRLRRCGTFLRQGLRSEAIQLSENEPNLLDLVALLDFPERLEWLQMANRVGLAPPTPLKLDVAAELNQAYALEQPLADLLRRHRLLALSRGPLPARIGVLRELAELDPNNPVWHDDLQIFEGERQKQIFSELEAAAKNGDAAAVAALNAELCHPGWKNPPPKDLVAAAAASLARMQYWSVQTEMQKTAQALEKAMADFDIEQGRALRETWNKLIAGYGYPPEAATAQKAQPALYWLGELDELRERQQRRETALSALEWAVQAAATPEKLADFYEQAEKLGDIPEELKAAYRARLALLERHARVRWWIVRGGIAAAAAALIILLGTFMTRHFFEREVEAAAASMGKMIDAKQYEQAISLLRELPERVREAPRIQEMAATLQKQYEKERARQADFSQRLQSAKLSLEGLAKSLGSEPGQAALDRAWQDLELIRHALEELHEKAKTEENRASLSETVKESGAIGAKLQDLTDAKFRKLYEEFEKRLSEAESGAQADAEARKQLVQKLRTDMYAWRIASNRVSVPEQQRYALLDDRRARLESDLARQEREAADLKKIDEAVGNSAAFLQALRDFAKNHPNAACAAAFNRTAEEAACWEPMAEWVDFTRQLRQAGLAGLSPETAQSRAETLEKLAQKFADDPEGAIGKFTRAHLPVLQAIARRIEDGERIEIPLKKLFADPLVADAWMIETTDGNRYYLKTEPNLNQGGSVPYIVTFDGNTKGKIFKKEDVRFAGRAPQVAVAAKVRPILAALRPDNWERSFSAMLAAIRADGEMDPFLKFNLLEQVLETGAKGSHCFAEAFGRHIEWLKDAPINAMANWLDPKITNVDAREAAAKAMKGFPDIAEASRSLENGLKLLEKNNIPEYRWVGWLRRGTGGWECAVRRGAGNAGNLIVLGRSPSNEKPQLNAVGRFDGQRAVIDAKESSILVEGRPVYLEAL